MSQTAYFAPPSPAADRVTQEAVTAEKGSSVNLNSSERLISELPKCTVRAEVNKTMCPVPVIGPGPFSAVWRNRESVCQPALQSRSWYRVLDVLYLLPCPSSYHSLSSCCCAEVGWEPLRSVGSTLDYVLGEINQIVWCYAVKEWPSKISPSQHLPLKLSWKSFCLSSPKGQCIYSSTWSSTVMGNELSLRRIVSWQGTVDGLV